MRKTWVVDEHDELLLEGSDDYLHAHISTSSPINNA